MKCIKSFLFCLMLSGLFFTQLYAQPEGYRNMYIDDFRYGLFVPPDYHPDTAYHLILYLHGYSDTTSWNFQWYQPSWQNKFPTIVVTPKCTVEHEDGWGDSWAMEESWAMGYTFRAIDSILEEYNIDTTRMHVGGTSMGGFGTFYVLASRPGMFASAWATCGGGNPATAELLKNTPLWIFHGSDDQTVPVRYSRRMYAALLNAGGNMVRYTEYAGVGHNAWDYVGQEATLYPWLFAQQLGSEHGNPDPAVNFSAELNSNNFPHLSWDPPADQSTDDMYIWAYRIYRNDNLYTTVNNDVLEWTDIHAAPDSSYRYSVESINYFFRPGTATPEIEVETESVNAVSPALNAGELLTLYPNPVVGEANIEFTIIQPGTVDIAIYDNMGSLVYRVHSDLTESGRYRIPVNLGYCSAGLYQLVFTGPGTRRSVCTLQVK